MARFLLLCCTHCFSPTWPNMSRQTSNQLFLVFYLILFLSKQSMFNRMQLPFNEDSQNGKRWRKTPLRVWIVPLFCSAVVFLLNSQMIVYLRTKFKTVHVGVFFCGDFNRAFETCQVGNKKHCELLANRLLTKGKRREPCSSLEKRLFPSDKNKQKQISFPAATKTQNEEPEVSAWMKWKLKVLRGKVLRCRCSARAGIYFICFFFVFFFWRRLIIPWSQKQDAFLRETARKSLRARN